MDHNNNSNASRFHIKYPLRTDSTTYGLYDSSTATVVRAYEKYGLADALVAARSDQQRQKREDDWKRKVFPSGSVPPGYRVPTEK